MHNEKLKEIRHDKEKLNAALLTAGGKPAKGGMWHCPYHQDNTASSWVKLGGSGWYFKCFTCNIWLDFFDIEAKNTGKEVGDLIRELTDSTATSPRQYYYPTISDLLDSLDAISIEEVNPYTNPDDGNVDLLIIRYLPRGGNKKVFTQAYQTPKGFINRRPAGLLPLFNRARVRESDTILYVEGEKCVRALTKLGMTATTGSGGAANALGQDYSPLAGKTVFVWPDFDEPGQKYAEQVKDKLLELNPVPTVYMIDPSELELPDHGDVVDLIERAKAEGGGTEDCKIQVELVMAEADESNRLGSLEALLDDMREGRYVNLPIIDMPILTHEARMLINKKIGVIYGNAGHGKSLLVGKMSDDLALRDYKVARLQLEDELELHLLRTFAQQAERSELASNDFHKNNPEWSKELYQEYKRTLDHVAASVFSGESENWTVDKLLAWCEEKLKAGVELLIIDPVSVIMGDKIWVDSHKMVWGLKRLLAKYPNGRAVLVAHPNDNGEVGGGKAYRRFCHTLLILNRFKEPKEVTVIDKDGQERLVTAESSIGISKTRYGAGNGLEIAVKLNPQTLCMEELGVIIKDHSSTTSPRVPKSKGRDLEQENQVRDDVVPF